jgi:hypothetical protein
MEKRDSRGFAEKIFAFESFFLHTHGSAMLNVATECDDASISFFLSRHGRRLCTVQVGGKQAASVL